MKQYFDQLKNENPQLILDIYDHATALRDDFEMADQYEDKDYYTKVFRFTKILDELIDLLPIDGIQLSLFGELDGEEKKDYFTLQDDFTFTKPKGFKFLDEKYIQVHSFKDLYIEILRILYRKDPILLKSVINKSRFNGSKKAYFSTDKKQLGKPIEIDNDFYCESHFNTQQIRNMLIRIFKLFSLNEEDLIIYIRLDHKRKYRYYE